MCELLLKAGARGDFGTSKGGKAVHAVCGAGWPTVAKLLLQNGATVTKAPKDLLVLAIKYCTQDTVLQLIKAGADVTTTVSMLSCKSNLAAQYNMYEAVRALLDKGVRALDSSDAAVGKAIWEMWKKDNADKVVKKAVLALM